MKTLSQLLFLILIGCQSCSRNCTEPTKINPLLSRGSTPCKTLPLYEIKPEHIQANAEMCFENKLKEMKQISKLNKTQTFGQIIFSFFVEANNLVTLISYSNNQNSINRNRKIRNTVQKPGSGLTIGLAKVNLNGTVKKSTKVKKNK